MEWSGVEAGEGWMECRRRDDDASDWAMHVFVEDGRRFTCNKILKTTIKTANLRSRANRKISGHFMRPSVDLLVNTRN